MFKAKKLDKLVQAGIIDSEQKERILAFEDTSGSAFVVKALNLLAIFTIGIGVTSLVASNWDVISDSVKLFLMFTLLFGVAGMAVFCQHKGQIDKAEKWLVALFLFVGATIGLVIQIYHLSGGKMYMPFVFWCVATLSLLFVIKKKYVAYFWVPLFLYTVCWVISDWGWRFFFETWSFRAFTLMDMIYMGVFSVLAVVGRFLIQSGVKTPVGIVLQKQSMFCFYVALAIFILWDCWTDSVMNLLIAAFILGVLSFVYHKVKYNRGISRNIKFAGLWVFAVYIHLGDKIGLFSTGIGMIISGVVLIGVLKAVAKLSKQVKGGKANA